MPTENLSSNTEQMVSVPRPIGDEPLKGMYYPAECRKCGWIGSSGECTDDDALCTRETEVGMCLGDTDEVEAHRLLEIIQKELRQPAAQHQGEPVAVLYADGTVLTKAECGDAFITCCKVQTPLYSHPPTSDGASPEQMAAQGADGYRNGIKAAAELAADYPELAKAIRDLPLPQ